MPAGNIFDSGAATVTGYFGGGHPGGVTLAAMAEYVVEVSLSQAKLPTLKFFWGEVGWGISHSQIHNLWNKVQRSKHGVNQPLQQFSLTTG